MVCAARVRFEYFGQEEGCGLVRYAGGARVERL
jgi:hypothetical protein